MHGDEPVLHDAMQWRKLITPYARGWDVLEEQQREDMVLDFSHIDGAAQDICGFPEMRLKGEAGPRISSSYLFFYVRSFDSS